MLIVAVGALFAVSPITRTVDGIRLRLPSGTLALEVRDPHTIRVQFTRSTRFFDRNDFVEVSPSPPHTPFTVRNEKTAIFLRTASLQARVQLPTGTVSFLDLKGEPILSESGRSLQAATVQGEKTFHVHQTWKPNAQESLYGLGQRSMGPLDIKGIDLDLWQRNSFVVVPFLTSSRGYGLFWNNPSYTRFGDLRKAVDIPADQLEDVDGKSGGLTGSYYSGRNFDRLVATRTDSTTDFPNRVSGSDGKGFPGGKTPVLSQGNRDNKAIHPDLPNGDISVRWEGFILPRVTGDYLFDGYSNGGIRLFVNGKLVVDHYRQSWLPEKDVAKVRLVKGQKAKIKLEWVKDQGADTMVFRWKTPAPSSDTSLWSEVGDGIDYTFVFGPSLDRVIKGYREITGRATMPPKWAFGLWQSRQRYETQQQSLDVIDGFRKRGIPFDNIVQDWFYWEKDKWGSHQFDPARFPDPVGWIKSIHDQHAHVMISVWGKFYPGTDNFNALNSKGFLYQPNLLDGTKDWVNEPFTFFDPFRPKARELFWSQIDRELFKKGIDAWWMDASEPDLMSIPNLEGHRARMSPTGLGVSSNGINLYALATAQAVFEGQRKAAPNQRVMNLTRSGYAGQQRYGATTWSGDITSTWTSLQRQIPAGLDFSISGNPYWTMDTGGFSVPSRFASRTPKPEDLEEWRELNTRWFEFATFVPLLRVHGEFPYREMWQFGGESSPTYKAMLKFDRLRYRLLPYVYSIAGSVTRDGATFMRPLVMDFPDDLRLRDVRDEYMFGPNLLVSPVVHNKERTRSVLLPQGTWYDFWTGKAVRGGGTIEASAPYDQIPLFLRAGSILPFGPELHYTGEKKADPITLVIYTGADGQFSLYEDDGLTNAYERGAFSRIPISWSEKNRTLTIGAHKGSFKGMLASRTFRVRFVSPSRPGGSAVSNSADAAITYVGNELQIRESKKP